MKRIWLLFILASLSFVAPDSSFSQNDDTGLVKEFLVLGSFPFQAEPEQPLLTDPVKGEAEIIPHKGLTTAGKTWQKAVTAPNGILDFKAKGIDFGDNAVGYAHVYLKVPVQQAVKFLVGSDDGVAVFVNGVLVHEHHIYRGISLDQDEFSATLAKGWNRVLCKVFNGHGGYALALRVLKSDNSEVPGLEISADNPISPPTNFLTPVVPAQYIFRNLGLAPELVLNENGTLEAQIEGFIFNLGNQSAPKLQLKTQARKIGEIRSDIPTSPLKREFKQSVPLTEMIKNTLSDSPIMLELSWENRTSTNTIKIQPQEMLDLIFNPISLSTQFTQTKVNIYGHSIIEFPKFLKNAKVAIIHPLDEVELRLNGKMIAPLVTPPSDVPFTTYTIFPIDNSPKMLNMEISYSIEKTQGKQIPAQLVVYEPKYHQIRKAIELSQIFENEDFLPSRFPFHQLLAAISKSNWNAFADALSAYDQPVDKFSQLLQQNRIHFVGNAHIDLAWLWPWTETVEVCRETFANALELMEAHPDFTYAQSQAQTYAWIEKYYPDIFEKIKQKVKAGQWIIVNGMWTEPDSNLPSGEAFVRQILYGQRYFKEKFGITTDVAWTPDTFGYAWTLPQIYKKAGFNYFVTNKIWWNDVTQPEHHLFWWESPDGTRILTFLPKGYGNVPTSQLTLNRLKEYYDNTKQPDFMILYGHGDHGGGPTEKMVSSIEEFSERKVFPKVEFSTPNHYFSAIEKNSAKFPVLRDEMYLEYHRGCYTTQAKTKKYNRQMECLLETAEKFTSFAKMAYPKEELYDAWQRTLFNQFHDILPGSSIPIVYEHALASYDTAKAEVDRILLKAAESIAKQVDTNGWGTPFIAFNPLSWGREGVMEVALPNEFTGQSLRVTDSDRWVVKSQLTTPGRLLVELTQKQSTPLPAIGYKVYHIQVGENRPPKDAPEAIEWTLKNKFFEITLDKKTGNIASIKDLRCDREVLSGPGNELQFFEDIPEQYDAWNIGYTGKQWRCDKNPTLEIVEQGPVRATIRVTRTFGKSKFVQDISLYRRFPIIEFRNHVDWHEAHVLVKAAFPLTVKNDNATYEIPYGWIQRPTIPKTAADSAKFEVSAHKWIDLTDAKGDYGVSLLNDCKYGFDVKGSLMRITLLRSPKNPDPEADMGEHRFVYALYPHEGDWRQARTHQFAYELNYPCVTFITGKHSGIRPKDFSFARLEGNPGVMLTTIKKAEERDALILRLVEYYGKADEISLTLPGKILSAREVDLIETPQPGKIEFNNSTLKIAMKPFEIKSVEVALTK